MMQCHHWSIWFPGLKVFLTFHYDYSWNGNALQTMELFSTYRRESCASSIGLIISIQKIHLFVSIERQRVVCSVLNVRYCAVVSNQNRRRIAGWENEDYLCNRLSLATCHCREESVRHLRRWTESNSTLQAIRLSLTQRFKISDSFTLFIVIAATSMQFVDVRTSILPKKNIQNTTCFLTFYHFHW